MPNTILGNATPQAAVSSFEANIEYFAYAGQYTGPGGASKAVTARLSTFAGTANVKIVVARGASSAGPTELVSALNPGAEAILAVTTTVQELTTGDLLGTTDLATNDHVFIGFLGDAAFRLHNDGTTGQNINLNSSSTYATGFNGAQPPADQFSGDPLQSIELEVNDAAVALTVDAFPASVRAGVAFNVDVSNFGVTPTTGNSVIRFTNTSGPAATINSVADQGGGVYRINATFPVGTAHQFSDTATIPLYVAVGAANATTGNVAYIPPAGWASVLAVSPSTDEGSLAHQHTGDAPPDGLQAVHETTSDQGIAITVDADLGWNWASRPTDTDSFDFYFIEADGTVSATATINAPDYPSGTTTFGTPTVGQTTALLPFTYSDTDVTGFRYNVDDGPWIAIGGSPVSLTGLTANTSYTIKLEPLDGLIVGDQVQITITTQATVDVTPDQFTLNPVTGVQPGTSNHTSNIITVTGVSAGEDIPISVSGAMEYSYSTDGGVTYTSWTSTAGNVRLNYRVRVRLDASANFSTTVSETLTIGGVTDDFPITTVADTINPVITLLGDNPRLISIGGTWTDPGATATDNADGDLTGSISTTGTVDTATAGTYVITYSVTDTAGNTGTATRDVEVIALPAGTITFGSTTITQNSALIPFTYDDTDTTGFEYRVDGGSWVATDSPISLSGLTVATSYAVDCRAINGPAVGPEFSTSITTLAATDLVPDAFNFADQTDVAVSTSVETNQITVLGVTAGLDVPISVTNGEYRYSSNGGATWSAWTSTAGNVRLNWRVQARHTSSASHSTPVLASGQVTTAVTIGGVADSFTSTTIADTTVPVIVLNGGTVTLNVGDNYTEQGATATDDVGGDITADIVTTGTVDTANPGTYSIYYNVTDASGNAAAQVVRTVNVVLPTLDAYPYERTSDWVGSRTPELVAGDTFRRQITLSSSGSGYDASQASSVQCCVVNEDHSERLSDIVPLSVGAGAATGVFEVLIPAATTEGLSSQITRETLAKVEIQVEIASEKYSWFAVVRLVPGYIP